MLSLEMPLTGEEKRAYNREYYEANREKELARIKAWREDNLEERRALQAKRTNAAYWWRRIAAVGYPDIDLAIGRQEFIGSLYPYAKSDRWLMQTEKGVLVPEGFTSMGIGDLRWRVRGCERVRPERYILTLPELLFPALTLGELVKRGHDPFA